MDDQMAINYSMMHDENLELKRKLEHVHKFIDTWKARFSPEAYEHLSTMDLFMMISIIDKSIRKLEEEIGD